MSIGRITEITSTSKKSFDDAVELGIKRATKTLDNVTGAWIKDHEVVVEGETITEYKVRMMVTFLLND